MGLVRRAPESVATMNRLGKFLMWASLAAVVLLAVLSVVGAFLGAPIAAAMFNSVPAAVYWCLLAVLLVAGCVMLRRLWRDVGLLAMHLGCVAIIAGGMWGSQAGLDMQNSLLGRSKIRRGRIGLAASQASDTVFADDRPVALGRLAFSLKLERAWVEYYPPAERHWPLHLVVDDPSRPDGFRTRSISTAAAQNAAVALGDVQVEVLDCVLPGETHRTPAILASTGEQTEIVPLTADQPVELKLLKARLKVLRVFGNLRVYRRDGKYVAEDIPGPADNPAVEVLLEFESSQPRRTYLFPPARTISMGHQSGSGVMLMYLPRRTRPRHGRAVPPIVKLRMRRGGRIVTGWLAGEEYLDSQLLPLAGLYDSEQAWKQAGSARVVLQRPHQDIRDYKSELVVMRDGLEVQREVIEVNRPLRYGGYHFYQAEFHPRLDAGGYTVLTVVSDSGLPAVYIGFVLLFVGVVWRMWFSPPLAPYGRGPYGRGVGGKEA